MRANRRAAVRPKTGWRYRRRGAAAHPPEVGPTDMAHGIRHGAENHTSRVAPASRPKDGGSSSCPMLERMAESTRRFPVTHRRGDSGCSPTAGATPSHRGPPRGRRPPPRCERSPLLGAQVHGHERPDAAAALAVLGVPGVDGEVQGGDQQVVHRGVPRRRVQDLRLRLPQRHVAEPVAGKVTAPVGSSRRGAGGGRRWPCERWPGAAWRASWSRPPPGAVVGRASSRLTAGGASSAPV